MCCSSLSFLMYMYAMEGRIVKMLSVSCLSSLCVCVCVCVCVYRVISQACVILLSISTFTQLGFKILNVPCVCVSELRGSSGRESGQNS